VFYARSRALPSEEQMVEHIIPDYVVANYVLERLFYRS